MRLSQAWIIAAKEFSILRRKKGLIISVVLFPLIIGIGLPLILHYVQLRNAIPDRGLTLINAFSFFYIIIASALPITLASYSLVGEKVEKSIEPLLATPTTDGEILLGKGIAAFLPPIITIFGSAVIFMTLIDIFTYNSLSYLIFPNWTIGTILLLITPLTAITAIEICIIISIRASDVRSAQQWGLIQVIPFGAIYVLSEMSIITLNTNNLLIISGVLTVIDIFLLYISTITFRRDKLLIRQK
ncbi:MAG: ABC transporter permease subunit [Promethearchaeota archaeon]